MLSLWIVRHGEDFPRLTTCWADKLSQCVGGRIARMSIEEIEAEALKLDPKARARLAEKLLESLEALSDQENERLWAEEAERRDADWDSTPGTARAAADVFRDARAKLK